ncbi:MAG: DEAD/DEAH box helicase family protein [Dehalococcoidia bacterium]
MTLSEADTRARLIDPALYARGWTEDMIRREETDGGIYIAEGRARRRSHGRVDYTLRVKARPDGHPVAVALIEAKAEHLPPAYGLEQVKLYAASKRLNLPFAFTSNGHQFVQYDAGTSLTSEPLPIAAFPTPEELQHRYEELKGFRLTDPSAAPLSVPYPRGQASIRYYQDAAIRAVLEKLARGEKRALLSLATGSGKTKIAVNLLKRIDDAGQMRRALFVCDRDELRTQGHAALNQEFGSNAALVQQEYGGRNKAKNARVHVATYQTLGVASDEDDSSFLRTHYPENYFTHIVIDECHRSAWGKWSELLTRNPDAVQIGLTATPRRLDVAESAEDAVVDLAIQADNIRHFGEPVYEYDIAQGIEDGYLAACEIIRRDPWFVGQPANERESELTHTDLKGKKLVDTITGEVLSISDVREKYLAPDFEDRIQLPERVNSMTNDLFSHLVRTGGPEQKTIIFCARDSHAEQVAIRLNNWYAAWCKDEGKKPLESYAFKCTAASFGNDFLPELRDSSRSHFVATTVDLLTTGVDVPIVRNIVFFKYVKSPIAFYQMVGRGTRLHPQTAKLMFRVYDYTNATRLFGKDFISSPGTRTTDEPSGSAEDQADEGNSERTIQVEGFEVRISDAGRYILTSVDGKATPVTVEEYKGMVAESLTKEAATLDGFRDIWVLPDHRRELLNALPDGGRSASVIRELENMKEYDLYDVLGEIGYGLNPLTRKHRTDAFDYKHSRWLDGMPDQAAAAIKAIAQQFARAGTEGIENPEIFSVPAVDRAGGVKALRLAGKPVEVLAETKSRMFSA